jgi:Ca2+-binding RTX toxin-like protein
MSSTFPNPNPEKNTIEIEDSQDHEISVDDDNYMNKGTIRVISGSLNIPYTQKDGIFYQAGELVIGDDGQFTVNTDFRDGYDGTYIPGGFFIGNFGTFINWQEAATSYPHPGYGGGTLTNFQHNQTIANGGYFENNGRISQTGRFINLKDHEKVVLNNNGVIRIKYFSEEEFSALVNHKDSRVENTVKGKFEVERGAAIINYGKFYNRGTIEYGGTLYVNGKGGLSIDRTGKFFNFGTLQSDNGTIDGQVENLGLMMSKQPSKVLINGDLDSDQGTLVFKIGSNDFNTENHDHYVVKGDVELGGDLVLEIIDSAQISLGSEFQILTTDDDLYGHFNGLPEGSLVATYLSSQGDYHDLRITYESGDGNDISLVTSRNGNDFLGSGSKDTLQGSGFSDYLSAGSGNDELYGALGSDVLTGGEGSDRFVYRDINESKQGPQSRDVITDFSSSEDDKIDLSAIADDSVFIGASDFTGTKPEIRFDDGILQLAAPDFYTPLFNYYEPDSAPTPVFEIQLLGVDSLSVDDLIM